jgi:hypothetical protein
MAKRRKKIKSLFLTHTSTVAGGEFERAVELDGAGW